VWLKMGNKISPPLIDETPKDFMIRNDQAFFTEPYLSNLAGWSAGKTQLDPFPREGSFKDAYMQSAKDMIFGNWGDPNWDFDYMKRSYKTWETMKKYWNRGPEIDKTAERNKDQKSSPSQGALSAQPDRETQTAQNPVTQSERKKSFSHTADVSVPHPPKYESIQTPAVCETPVRNKLYPDLKAATTFPFVETSDGFKVHPLPLADVVAICKELPDPTKTPHQYVSVLKRLTAYSQLTGRDYRFILTKTLPAEITEEELIEEIDLLRPIHDAPPARSILIRDSEPVDLSRSFRGVRVMDDYDDYDVDWVWANAGKLQLFFKQLTTFLMKLSSAKQDISHAANTKQKAGESPVAFFNRFKRAWIEESAIPVDDDNCQLFVNTFLNNMHDETAQLIRITTNNFLTMSIDDLGKRLRELSSAGAFVSSRGKTPIMLQVDASAPNRPVGYRPKPLTCFCCGSTGHVAKFCRQKLEMKQANRNQMRRRSDGYRPRPQPSFSPSQKQQPVYQTEWKRA